MTGTALHRLVRSGPPDAVRSVEIRRTPGSDPCRGGVGRPLQLEGLVHCTARRETIVDLRSVDWRRHRTSQPARNAPAMASDGKDAVAGTCRFDAYAEYKDVDREGGPICRSRTGRYRGPLHSTSGAGVSGCLDSPREWVLTERRQHADTEPGSFCLPAKACMAFAGSEKKKSDEIFSVFGLLSNDCGRSGSRIRPVL